MRESITYIRAKAERRKRRVRAKIRGTSSVPRLSLHISNKHVSAQFIDDESGFTVFAVHDSALNKKMGHITREFAGEFGKKTAELARAKGIGRAVFDRGARRYAGRVKAFAEAARGEGLQF